MELVAQTYANALLSLAIDDKNDERIMDQLNDIYGVIDKDNSLIKLMENRNISKNEKRDIIITLFDKKVEKTLLNFMKLLVDKSRINELKEICVEYRKQYYEHYGIKEAKVYSATKLSNETINELKVSLEEKYNKKFIVNTFIDENLIAGLKVVIGDLVIDGSISNKLDRLKDSITKIKN